MESKIRLKQAIIVEGRYDKIRLDSVVEGLIIETGGFHIYKDKEKLTLIKALAEKDGIIILTDSDHAGFQIRNYLKSCIGGRGKIINVYAPDIFGKERRKEHSSAEGKLGVEGIPVEILRKALTDAGVETGKPTNNTAWATRSRLLDDGLIGGSGSAERRKAVQRALGFPENLSSSAFIDVLNSLTDEGEYTAALAALK